MPLEDKAQEIKQEDIAVPVGKKSITEQLAERLKKLRGDFYNDSDAESAVPEDDSWIDGYDGVENTDPSESVVAKEPDAKYERKPYNSSEAVRPKNFGKLAADLSGRLGGGQRRNSDSKLSGEVSTGTDSRLTRLTGLSQDELSTVEAEDSNKEELEKGNKEIAELRSQLSSQLEPLVPPKSPMSEPETPEFMQKMSEREGQGLNHVASKNTPSLESIEKPVDSMSKIKKQLPEKLKNLKDALEELSVEAKVPGSPLNKKDKKLIADYLQGVTSRESGVDFPEENEATAFVFIANQKLNSSQNQKVSKAKDDTETWHSALQKESRKAYKDEYHVEKVWFSTIRGYIFKSRAKKEDTKKTLQQRFLLEYEMRKIEEKIEESHNKIESYRDNFKKIEDLKTNLEERKKELNKQLEETPALPGYKLWKRSGRAPVQKELKTVESMLKTLDKLRQQEIDNEEYEDTRLKVLENFLAEKQGALFKLTELSEEALKARQDLKKGLRENRKAQNLLKEKKILEEDKEQVEEQLKQVAAFEKEQGTTESLSNSADGIILKQNLEAQKSQIEVLEKENEALEEELDRCGNELDAITQKSDSAMREDQENLEANQGEERTNLEDKLKEELEAKEKALEAEEKSFKDALDEVNEADTKKVADELVALPSDQWEKYKGELKELGVESMLKGLKKDSARAFHTHVTLEKVKTLFPGKRESKEQTKFRKAYMLNFQSKQIEGAQDKLKEISDRLEKAIEEATSKVPKNQNVLKAILGALKTAIVGVSKEQKKQKKQIKKDVAVLRNLEKIKAQVERQEKLLEREQSKITVLADGVMQKLLEKLKASRALTLKTSDKEAMDAIRKIEFEGISVEQTVQGDHETNISRASSQSTIYSNSSKFIIDTNDLPAPLSSGYTVARGKKQVGGGSVRSNTNKSAGTTSYRG